MSVFQKNENRTDITYDLSENIFSRKVVDRPMLNWWISTFFLSVITFGIYGIYNFIVRINRVDSFIERKHDYYKLIVEYTERAAYANRMTSYPEREMLDLAKYSSIAINARKPIGVAFTIILLVLSLGLYFIFYIYQMNKVWNDLQIIEKGFYEQLDPIWIRLGLISGPIPFQTSDKLRKSFLLNLFLSFVTLGIWFLVWDYQIQVMPDDMYHTFHRAEDEVLEVIVNNPVSRY